MNENSNDADSSSMAFAGIMTASLTFSAVIPSDTECYHNLGRRFYGSV